MKRLAVAFAALLAATPALADNTDTATVTVSGQIVANLEITSTTALTMPHLVARGDGSTDTSVTVQCGANNAGNTVSYSGNGSPFAGGNTSATAGVDANSDNKSIVGANSTGTCAVVTVTGEANYNFNVTTGNVVSPNDLAGLTLSAPTCSTSAGALITQGAGATATAVNLGAGTTTIRCGATITAGATSLAGNYTNGSFDVTVTYD